nr:hypothetical protein [Candidatus Njordarchaeum guaymaensis]
MIKSKADIEKEIPHEINIKLRYEEDREDCVIRIIPIEYLGSDNFSKLARIVREHGGDYISAGKNSYFRVPWKETEALQQRAHNLELAARYEEAAQIYEELGMHEKAGEARRMQKAQYVISTSFQLGKDGSISISCPHCGASQPAESKTSEVDCKYCGKKYMVPKKILDMI